MQGPGNMVSTHRKRDVRSILFIGEGNVEQVSDLNRSRPFKMSRGIIDANNDTHISPSICDYLNH